MYIKVDPPRNTKVKAEGTRDVTMLCYTLMVSIFVLWRTPNMPFFPKETVCRNKISYKGHAFDFIGIVTSNDCQLQFLIFSLSSERGASSFIFEVSK